jgi:hypothetical protein
VPPEFVKVVVVATPVPVYVHPDSLIMEAMVTNTKSEAISGTVSVTVVVVDTIVFVAPDVSTVIGTVVVPVTVGVVTHPSEINELANDFKTTVSREAGARTAWKSNSPPC